MQQQPCSGVVWCDASYSPRPSSCAALPAACTCVDATASAKSFHDGLNVGLSHRRKLGRAKPHAKDAATRVAAVYNRAKDYGLLAHGLLTLLRHSPGAPPLSTLLPPPTASHPHDHWLEFGVASASSTNITCDALTSIATRGGSGSGLVSNHHHHSPRVSGFDTFTGLPEAWDFSHAGYSKQWGYMAAGRFTQHGVLPPVQPCATLHKGLINRTLPMWIAAHRTRASPLLGVSIDVDIYSASYAALLALQQAGMLGRGSLVHFHE